jgi:hypothetical protein
MTETALPPLEQPRRFHFDWLLPAFIRPRAIFAKIGEYAGGAWLTPLLLLTLVELVKAYFGGNARAQFAAAQPVPVPDPGFGGVPQPGLEPVAPAAPDMMLTHIFPGALGVMGVWIAWLLVAAVLHLALTLLGGRSAMRNTMNVVAWAMVPFIIRGVANIFGYALFPNEMIDGLGLSGFAGTENLFLKALLEFVDIYLLWHVILLAIGSRFSSGLGWGKALGGVIVAVGLVLLLQALPGWVYAQIVSMGPLF